MNTSTQMMKLKEYGQDEMREEGCDVEERKKVSENEDATLPERAK